MELTQIEQQYTSDGVRFEFEVVAAYSVYPNSGPTAGGTLVEVRGAGIELPDARGLFCQFGASEPVAATHSSRELVWCVSPAADGGAAIVDGNRKVLAARLSDARFFWEVDQKKTLAQHAEGLKRITFHEKLGTVARHRRLHGIGVVAA